MTAQPEPADLLPPLLSRGEHPDFVDVDRVVTADGILIIVSQRKDTGRLTFGIFRRYLRNDDWKRTSFIPELLIEAVTDAIALAKELMARIRAHGHQNLVMPVPPLK